MLVLQGRVLAACVGMDRTPRQGVTQVEQLLVGEVVQGWQYHVSCNTDGKRINLVALNSLATGPNEVSQPLALLTLATVRPEPFFESDLRDLEAPVVSDVFSQGGVTVSPTGAATRAASHRVTVVLVPDAVGGVMKPEKDRNLYYYRQLKNEATFAI